jgi:uncharacterized protein involved in type VI secretion and phage assembly
MLPFNTSNGIVIGIVHSLDDPDKMGRVLLVFPYLNDECSDWARVLTFMAGKDSGAVFIPEVGDEVLVGFLMGDPRQPVVLGGLFSKVDTIPERTGSQTDNNQRLIKSRSGHKVILDDTSGGENITLIDKDGKRKVILSSSDRKIQVQSDEGDVEVTASTGNVKVKAMSISIEAQNDMTISAGTTLTIKGATVMIN